MLFFLCRNLWAFQGFNLKPFYTKDSHAKILLLSVLVFFLLYNISFKYNASLTTGRIAVLTLLGWALLMGRSPVALLNSRAWLVFLPLPYVAVQYFLVGDYGQLSRFINLAFYSYVGAALIVIIAYDVKVVFVAILAAIAVQAAILIFSFFSFEYRAWFDAITVSDSNYETFYLYRAPGFAGAGGSGLSLIQSLGVLVGWLLLRKNKLYEPVTGGWVYLVIFAMILSLMSCVAVGRIGLLLSVIFMGMFLLSERFRPGTALLLLVFSFSLYFIINNYLILLLADDFSLEYFRTWAFGFFTGNDNTVEAIFDMPIPPLSIETMHGSGLVSLIDGSNPSGHDSGFIQAYYSMGLPFTILLYAFYLYVLFYVMSWFPILMRITLAVIFFAIEAKEPFLFKYSTMVVLMSVHFSHVVIQNNRRKESRIEATEAT